MAVRLGQAKRHPSASAYGGGWDVDLILRAATAGDPTQGEIFEDSIGPLILTCRNGLQQLDSGAVGEGVFEVFLKATALGLTRELERPNNSTEVGAQDQSLVGTIRASSKMAASRILPISIAIAAEGRSVKGVAATGFPM